MVLMGIKWTKQWEKPSAAQKNQNFGIFEMA